MTYFRHMFFRIAFLHNFRWWYARLVCCFPGCLRKCDLIFSPNWSSYFAIVLAVQSVFQNAQANKGTPFLQSKIGNQVWVGFPLFGSCFKSIGTYLLRQELCLKKVHIVWNFLSEYDAWEHILHLWVENHFL